MNRIHPAFHRSLRPSRRMYYVMDDDGGIYEVDDALQWARWFETSLEWRRIAVSEFNGVRVSTVFLGMNHQWGEGDPLIFETMIFGGALDQYQDRTSNRPCAIAMHWRAVAEAKLAMQMHPLGHVVACLVCKVNDVQMFLERQELQEGKSYDEVFGGSRAHRFYHRCAAWLYVLRGSNRDKLQANAVSRAIGEAGRNVPSDGDTPPTAQQPRRALRDVQRYWKKALSNALARIAGE